MIKHNITAKDYTDICFHCKEKLKTDQEKKQGYCEECWQKYREEKLERSLKHLHQEITEHIHPYVAIKIEKVQK